MIFFFYELIKIRFTNLHCYIYIYIYSLYDKMAVFILNKLQIIIRCFMNLFTNLHNPYSSLYILMLKVL